MVELTNYTPYPNFRYYSCDNQDREFGVIIVKATYVPTSSGRLEPAEEQAPMVFTDLCHGAVNVSSLWHPSDLVPNKPATDVIVNAVARAPRGEATPSWLCGVRILAAGATVCAKTVRVTGPREWVPVWLKAPPEDKREKWRDLRMLFRRWKLSEPELVTEVPLRYEYAFGGELAKGENEDGQPVFDTDERNPIGRGKVNVDWTDHTRPVPAPQIEDPDLPIDDPLATPKPEGLGPIPPAWLPRQPLGGTYDDNWVEKIWPAWAPDYDFAYHNSAHPDLIVTPYLTGSETVELTGVTTGRETVSLTLPGERILVDFVAEDGGRERRAMNLDTLFLDVAAPDPADWRVYVSWRVNYEPDVFEGALIHGAGEGAELEELLEQEGAV